VRSIDDSESISCAIICSRHHVTYLPARRAGLARISYIPVYTNATRRHDVNAATRAERSFLSIRVSIAAIGDFAARSIALEKVGPPPPLPSPPPPLPIALTGEI
jgi:hypothetical protein